MQRSTLIDLTKNYELSLDWPRFGAAIAKNKIGWSFLRMKKIAGLEFVSQITPWKLLGLIYCIDPAMNGSEGGSRNALSHVKDRRSRGHKECIPFCSLPIICASTGSVALARFNQTFRNKLRFQQLPARSVRSTQSLTTILTSLVPMNDESISQLAIALEGAD